MPNIEAEELLDKVLDTTPHSSEGVLTPSLTLIKEGQDISERIVSTTDAAEFEDLTKLFKMNMQKKSMIRANRLSGLLELVDDEVVARFTQYPESFDNDQLLKYMTATQQAVQGIENQLNQAPIIQINNQTNEVNINQSGLDRDSRSKVLEAVNSILEGIKNGEQSIIDVDPKNK